MSPAVTDLKMYLDQVEATSPNGANELHHFVYPDAASRTSWVK
jgi:hypothetical protein